MALPQKRVSQVRASELHHSRRIDAALEAFRLASLQAHDRLWRLGLGFVLLFRVIMTIARAPECMKFGCWHSSCPFAHLR